MRKRLTLLLGFIALIGTAGVFGLTPMASAAPASAAAHKTTVINLHRAFEARLGHTRPGKVGGIIYARGRHPRPSAAASSCVEPNCALTYHGGSVQHTPHVYLLLWGPDWSTDPSQQAAASYLESFYAGLGVQPTDHWSTVTSQYGDGSGFPAFAGSVYMGAFTDASVPPTGATQSDLAAEADAFTTMQGITDTSDAQIVVATQSGTCPQGFYAPTCDSGSGNYCSWHASSNEPYTNLPYLPDAGTACGEDFVNTNGSYDGYSMVGGGEYADTIVDPSPRSGWADTSDTVSGGEIADKCAWGGGDWGGGDPYSDVSLSTGSFAMGSLWSNIAKHCVLSPAAAPVSGLKATAKYTNLTASWNASRLATSYKVTVTRHQGAVKVASATVTGTSYHLGHLKEKTGYAVHVLAEPAAPGQAPTTVDVTTK